MISGADPAVAAFAVGDLDRARELAARQLERGSSPQLQHLMGLIDCRAGRLDSGIEWLRQASDAEPGNIGFRVMLVRALVDSRRPAEALAAAPAPSGASSTEQALWHVRAEAAQAAGDQNASAEAWRAICKFSPRDWRAWASKGNACASLKEWGEAVEAFRTAVGLNPSEKSIRQGLAAALKQAGDNREALAHIEALLRETPNSPELRFERAQILDDLGRAADSLGEFEEAARLFVASAGGKAGPGLIGIAFRNGGADVGVLRNLALLFERTNRMDSLATLVEQAQQNGITLAYPAAVVALHQGNASEAKQLLVQEEPELDPVRWHRLMSKIGEALRDPALAFSEANAMNRSVEDFEEWRKKGAAYRHHIRDLAEMFTPDWGASVPVLPAGPRRSPAFLVGFPRSGTTLLDTFLMGHPDVQVLEEVPMLTAAQNALGAMMVLPRLSQTRLEAARRAYFEELDCHVPSNFDGLVVDKLPMNMLALPLVYSLFPDARVIFAQRHPADAVLSGFMQSFILNGTMASFLDIHDAADLYDGAMSVFVQTRAVLSLDVHTSVYERLIVDPEQSLRPLIEFLGLDWKEELLDHQHTAHERGAIVTPSYDQVTQPLSKAPSGRWKRYRKELEPVLPILLPWAERLGYGD